MDRLQEIIAGMKASVGDDCGLGKRVKFDIAGAGPVLIDATVVPNTVTSDSGPADCTLSIALDDFINMVEGKADSTQLFMMGKLKITGDMGVAMKLGSVLKPR